MSEVLNSFSFEKEQQNPEFGVVALKKWYLEKIVGYDGLFKRVVDDCRKVTHDVRLKGATVYIPIDPTRGEGLLIKAPPISRSYRIDHLLASERGEDFMILDLDDNKASEFIHATAEGSSYARELSVEDLMFIERTLRNPTLLPTCDRDEIRRISNAEKNFISICQLDVRPVAD